MTISSTIRKAGPFISDGAVTVFPFSFKVFAASDLVVVQAITSTGVETTKALTADYTVALNADQNTTPGGMLTMLVAPPTGTTLTFTSAIANLQSMDLTNAGGFYPKVINEAMDRATILIQQLAEKLSRSLQFSLGNTGSSALPVLGDRANKLLGFDSLGNPVALTPATGTAADVLLQLSSLTDVAKGARLIGWLRNATGAVGRWLSDKIAENVSVKDFGAVGDGTTDDTAAFAAAFAFLGTKGGTVKYFDKHLIDANLTIPPSITLKGPTSQVGSPGTNASYPYGNMAALILNGAKSITLSGGSGLDGCLIYCKGMTFPAANTSLYTGTAIVGAGDDTFMIGCQVMGFTQAYYSTGYQRPRFRNVLLDNTNGIWIDNCADIPYFDSCHAWPFATVGNGGPTSTNRRAGYAFRFTTFGDWNKIANCFAYGYANGFGVTDCNSVTFLNCGTDSTGSYAGQVGFTVSGSSNDTRLIGCQAAAQETGYRITGTGSHTRMTNCDSWSCSNNGILLDTPVGDITVVGGIHRDTNRGITVNNPGGRLVVDLVRFYNIATAPFSFLIGNGQNCLIGANCDYGNFPVGSSVIDNPSFKIPTTVASAATLLLPPTGELYQVTGTTGIAAINAGWTGRKVTLIFSSPLTVTSTASLSLASNFTTATGSTLSLIHNGSSWFETGRKA